MQAVRVTAMLTPEYILALPFSIEELMRRRATHLWRQR
jgi:hypothetical protein